MITYLFVDVSNQKILYAFEETFWACYVIWLSCILSHFDWFLGDFLHVETQASALGAKSKFRLISKAADEERRDFTGSHIVLKKVSSVLFSRFVP